MKLGTRGNPGQYVTLSSDSTFFTDTIFNTDKEFFLLRKTHIADPFVLARQN